MHHDGLLALDYHYNMREMQSKYNIMENRLKHLENADSRSLKIKQKAEDKAQSMLEARNRHYVDMMNQIKWYQEKSQLLELQRIRNLADQKQRRQAIS